MKPIIQNITTEKHVDFTEEVATWFNGDMNVPVKTYQFNYPSILGTIEVIGEYRINTWRKANWYKSIYYTDIYLWTIKLNTHITLPNLEIRANSWIEQKILKQPPHKSELQKSSIEKGLGKFAESFRITFFRS